jgi:hypothetical protein
VSAAVVMAPEYTQESLLAALRAAAAAGDAEAAMFLPTFISAARLSSTPSS